MSSSQSCFSTSDVQTVHLLSIMAHDFRESLVYLSANLKLLRHGHYGNMDGSVKDRLGEMLKRVNRLTHTFEEWMRKISTPDDDTKMQHESLDLTKDIIDPVLEEYSTELKDRGIKVDNRLGSITQNQIRVDSNKIWLKAIFRNLIKNAIQHGDPGCTLTFDYEDRGSSCQVIVHNSGKPIPERWREKLFTKLEDPGYPTGLKSYGMGLGLYLTKKIIQGNGGDIRYEAEENGSNFVLTLPFSIPAT